MTEDIKCGPVFLAQAIGILARGGQAALKDLTGPDEDLLLVSIAVYLQYFCRDLKNPEKIVKILRMVADQIEIAEETGDEDKNED